MPSLRRILACAALAALLLVSPGSGSAQNSPGPIGQFLEISPVRNELTLDKNVKQTVNVKITNRHVAPIALQPSFDNILGADDDGNTKYTTEPTPYDLKRFATVDTNQFVLGPRESKVFSVTITMGNDAAPGGYYGEVRFSTVRRTDLPPVAIQGEIASLFLVRVPGPADERGNIKDLYLTDADGHRKGSFFFGNDLYWVTKVHNGGKVHFSTAAKVTAKDMIFGGRPFSKQTDSRNVFPGGDRKYEQRWENARSGLYRVTTSASVPGNANATKTIHVLVLTPVAAAITAGVLLVIILLIVMRVRGRRRRRRDIAV